MSVIISLWRRTTRGLRALLHRRAADDDLRDEVADYLERAAAEHAAAGLPPDAARRAARLELGNPTVVRETVRGAGWEQAIDTLAADLRHALRRLRAAPGFTAISVLTLALGVGAATAIFSAVNPILLAALPYPHADRLATVAGAGDDGTPLPATFGTFVELRARSRSFESLAAADHWTPSLTGTGDPDRLEGQRVTAGYFHTIGVLPAVGRAFDDAEDQPGGPNVVVLSDRLANRRFGGTASVLGRSILLDGASYRVIGVMPRTFSSLLAPAADVWAPMQARAPAPFESREWGHHYRIIGRLAGGATAAGAMRESGNIGRTPSAAFARPVWADWHNGLLIRPLRDDLARDARPTLLAITGAAALLLAIACVNVTSLLVARGAQRRGELAMRAALGAGRGRLLRQLLTESLVLAIVGGALALAVAALGVRALVALSPPDLPRTDAIGLDAPVFLFAFGLATVVGLLVGVAPALGAVRASMDGGLARGTRRGTAAGGHGRGTLVRRALVVAEVALALVLLSSAGLLMRSLERLFAVQPGFDSQGLLTMQVIESGRTDGSDAARERFFEQALDAVRRVPGVTAAAFTSQLPLSGELDGYGYEFESRPTIAPGDAGAALRYVVTPGYFETMHVPLRRGRMFSTGDRAGTPDVVILSESFTDHAFGNSNPIGQRARFGPDVGGHGPWRTVVGVVGDVKQESLARSSTDAFYVPAGQWSWVDDARSVVVRAEGHANALAPAVKRAIWSVDGREPIQRVRTMDALIAQTAAGRRFAFAIIETFAIAALVLAAIGLYGVVAGSVTEQTREIGIRAALGATSGHIVARVVGSSLLLATLGVAIGLGGAVAASRLLESLLFGVSRLDLPTYAGVTIVLTAVAALASWSPARRAARIDPAITLRTD